MICALKGGDLTSSLVALREAHGVGRARAWLDRRISPVSVGCGRGARAERALEAKPAAVQQRACASPVRPFAKVHARCRASQGFGSFAQEKYSATRDLCPGSPSGARGFRARKKSADGRGDVQPVGAADGGGAGEGL